MRGNPNSMINWFHKQLSDTTGARKRDEGFTLVELLVVILIIGVLSGIVVLAVSNSTGDAKAKACTQNATNLIAALDNYKATPTTLGGGEGSYPTPTPAAAEASGAFTGWKKYDPAVLTTALVPSFIKALPADINAYIKADANDNTTVSAGATTGNCSGTVQGK